jgi:hypothetical protein
VKTLESKETEAQRNETVTHNSVFAAAHRQCRMTIARSTSGIFFFQNSNQESRKSEREFDFPSTLNHQLSTVFPGGIAQLVERQLCKLEVRGSNPLASNARKAFRASRSVGLARADFRLSPFRFRA